MSLEGLNGWGAQFGGPRIRYGRRTIDLSPELTSFFVGEAAATFRVSANCPETGPSIQLTIYRAVAAADGSMSYSVRGLDLERNGRLTDKGSETTDAEGFWFR